MLGPRDEELRPWFPSRPVLHGVSGKLHPRYTAWLLEQASSPAPDRLHTPPPSSSSHSRQGNSPPQGVLLLVYWLSRAAGVLPLRYDDVTQALELSRWNLVYSVLTMMFLFGQWCFMTFELHTTFVQEGNVLSGVEPISLSILNLGLMVLALCRWPQLRSAVRLLAGLEAELSPRRSGPSALPCLLPMALAVLACTADISASLVDSTLLDTLMYVPYYWAAVGAVLVEVQFTAACLALRYCFWLLNQRLKVVRRRAAGACLRLESLRLCHGRLCAASVELDAAFGPQLLLCCALCSVGALLNAYFGLNGFYDGGNEEEASEGMQQTQWLWAALYLVRIFTICFAATRLAAEAIHTGRLVNVLGDSRLSPHMKEEISLFSMQIHTSKLEFTAWGIIVIDFSLLFAIVSTTTTYLLILIQYHPK